MEQPNNSGSQYRNYKGTDSIILMAVVGPKNQFLYADVGLNDIRTKPIEKNTLNLPKPKSLFSDSDDTSYVFVADDAFPLAIYMIKPCPQRDSSCDKRIFNYRLPRARQIFEIVFGILANRGEYFVSRSY